MRRLVIDLAVTVLTAVAVSSVMTAVLFGG